MSKSLNVIKVIRSDKTDKENGISRAELSALWRQACLYELDYKPLIQVLGHKGNHLRYMVKR